MAKRRAATTRARKKMILITGIVAVSLYAFGSMGLARAASPGSLVIDDGYPKCYPVASVTIRVGALASGPGKSNTVSARWTGGGMAVDFPPFTIDQSQYASAQPSDTVTVAWEARQGPDLGPYKANLSAALSWTWPNGNVKQVATASESRKC